MGKSKIPLHEKTERRWRDAVTGELCTLQLDAVQMALERTYGALERELARLSPDEQSRLVARLALKLARCVPHTDTQIERVAELLVGMT